MRRHTLYRTFLWLAFIFSFICLNKMNESFAQQGRGEPCQVGVDLASGCNACEGLICVENGSSGGCEHLIDDLNLDNTLVDCPTIHFNIGGTPDVSEIFPGCWVICENRFDEGSGQNVPTCLSSNSFCEGISGGAGPDTPNECRSAECTEDPEKDIANPSGCDYHLTPVDQNDACQFCTNAAEAQIAHCGNGICEAEQGEDCDTCPIDCRVPGFEGPCLQAGLGELNNKCVAPAPGDSFVTFPGSIFPICEDGDLCTANICEQGNCEVTALGCEPDADFCCPAGCEPPTGDSCRDDNGAPIEGCDPDCYVPLECPVPTSLPLPLPSSSPTPTATPFLCISGEGFGFSDHGSATDCGCALNKGGAEVPGKSAGMALIALALAAILAGRRRRKINES